MRGSLKRMPKSDTADKPEQENIQGAEYVVKKPNRQIPAAPKGRCKLMGGEAASTTNPEKGCAEKCKTNMKTVQGRVNWR